jgi:DNA-binding MarR family transcriptional regulator
MKAIQRKCLCESVTAELFISLQKLLRCFDFDRGLRGRTTTLTVRQMQVLSFFAEGEVVHISQVSRRLNMSMQNVNNLVKRLEVTGYVRRSKNAQDKRLSDICLTQKGRTGFAVFRTGQLATLNRLLEKLNEAERRKVLQALDFATGLLQDGAMRAAASAAMQAKK